MTPSWLILIARYQGHSEVKFMDGHADGMRVFNDFMLLCRKAGRALIQETNVATSTNYPVQRQFRGGGGSICSQQREKTLIIQFKKTLQIGRETCVEASENRVTT